MKWICFSGWALIISALIFLFGFAWDHLLNGPFTLFTVLLGVVGNISFLMGLPGIQQSQPQIGLFVQSAALIGYGLSMLQRDRLISSGLISGSS